ncbi:CLUMA_CG012727, isoform A [Clunio marinus]|uniref:CLUMA_CG012727, isoform A n=1 Tax=Clunio marinus TaxID=568069 RepID=A0A1J1IGU3_9DIPT|nr:CLUMA_CG012727, isoform A [Clunio marinus]
MSSIIACSISKLVMLGLKRTLSSYLRLDGIKRRRNVNSNQIETESPGSQCGITKQIANKSVCQNEQYLCWKTRRNTIYVCIIELSLDFAKFI